jgi:predicted ATPase
VHGFPAALTRFVGREEAVRDVAGLLEEFRLVTVTGPSGMGKTRLAGQVARQVAARFTDGAWLAELAPVRDPAQVAAVVAAALGIQEQSGDAASRYARTGAGRPAAAAAGSGQLRARARHSIRTVGSHLDRIRDKTGCRRRTDLTRLALSARLV